MKKLWPFLILLVPLICLAQGSPSPSPSITPVPFPTPGPDASLIPTVTGLVSLARGWQSMGLYAALAACLKLLADLSKLSFLGNPWSKVPDKYKLLVSAFIGAVLVFLGFLAAGVPILTAAAGALGSSAGAGFLHEVLQDLGQGSSGPSGS